LGQFGLSPEGRDQRVPVTELSRPTPIRAHSHGPYSRSFCPLCQTGSMHRRGLLSMVVPALSSMWAGSADSTSDRSTLRGLKSFKVVIDKLDHQLAADGLTEGRLQTQVEDKLRAAGIVVDDNAKEFLVVGVTSVRGKRTPYAL